MAHPDTADDAAVATPDPGWRRAGYDGPQLAKFDQDPGPHGSTGSERVGPPPDGWRDAGYTSPDCEQFAATV